MKHDEEQEWGAGGKRKEYSAPALEKGLDFIEAIARTAEQITAGLGH